MQNQSPKIDTLFKKILVIMSIGMFIFILIAFALYIFRGPDIREHLATAIDQESTVIYFSEESLKAGMSRDNENYAATVVSVISTLKNEQLRLSGEYGRALDDGDLTKPDTQIKSEVQAQKSDSQLDEFYSEQINKLLGVLRLTLQEIVDITDDKTIQAHIEQIDILLEP